LGTLKRGRGLGDWGDFSYPLIPQSSLFSEEYKMKVRHLLATKSADVYTIQPEQTIRQVLALLAEHNVGVLVVTDEQNQIVGIVSERDIVRQAAQHEDLFDLPVSEVMTVNVITGMPEDDMMSVSHTMTVRNFRHLPIVDHGRLVGILSIRDVLKSQLDEYKGEIDTLETRILADEDD
jgi:CBS domain-containing protein